MQEYNGITSTWVMSQHSFISKYSTWLVVLPAQLSLMDLTKAFENFNAEVDAFIFVLPNCLFNISVALHNYTLKNLILSRI